MNWCATVNIVTSNPFGKLFDYYSSLNIKNAIKKTTITGYFVAGFCFVKAQKSNEFTVLQWNVWQEGTMIPGGYDAIINEIVRLKPDFVTFSEVRNYNKTNFTARVCASLQERG